MNAAQIALWAAIMLTIAAIVPAVYVLAREAIRRAASKAAVRKIAKVEEAIREANTEKLEKLAKSLDASFGPLAVERALVKLLRGSDDAAASSAAKLFAQVGLVDTYNERIRHARAWGERVGAAEILGLVAHPTSVPALVAALRDPYEEMAVKTGAASSLAKLKDVSVVPLLIHELGRIDERSSPAVADALVAFGVLAVPDLLAWLERSEDGPARVWAVRILGRIGDPAAVDALCTHLRDRLDLVRIAAAEALGLIGDRRALQPLVNTVLRDPAAQVRANAAAAVASVAGSAAVDILVAALADPDYGTRLRALEAFESIHLEDTSALEGALRDANPEVRRRAALALERVGFLERVVSDLASEDSIKSERAYQQVLELGRAGLVDSVASYIRHSSFQVRARVALATAELGVARVGTFLLPAMDDAEWPVRAALCEAVGKLRPAGGAAELVKRLADAEESVREAAAYALASYGPSDLAPHATAIELAYERGSVPMRLQMVILASRVDTKEMGAIVIRGAADLSETVRLRAVDLLAAYPDSVSVPTLVARLTDSSLEVRMSAVVGLGAKISPEAFEGLLRALPGAAPDVRDRLADALAKGGRDHLFSHIEELVRADSLDVRLGIAWTLGKIADPRGLPFLAAFLTDRDAKLRASAAGALAKIREPGAVAALIRAIDDRDSRTRAAVVNALGRIARSDIPAFNAVKRRFSDPDPFVRNRAAIALARIGAGDAIGVLRENARRVDEVVAIVAIGLVGTDDAIRTALDALSTSGAMNRVHELLARESDDIRHEFYHNLRLEPEGGENDGPADVEALVATYEGVLRTSLDAQARKVAVEALCRLQSMRVNEILADALLGDPSEVVRLRAAQGLARALPEPLALRALIRAASDPMSEVAEVAIGALRTTRDPQVAAALFLLLGVGSPTMNTIVEEALAEIHRGDAMSFMDRMMGVDVHETIAASTAVLERLADPVALPLLMQLLRSHESIIRVAAVRALTKLPLPEASQALDAVVDDPDESVRAAYLESIAQTADPSAIMRIAQMRGDPSVDVRMRLTEVLVRYGTSSSSSLLDSLLDDTSPRVRASAMASLLAIGEDDSLARFAAAWPKVTLDTRRELQALSRGPRITEHLGLVLSVSTNARSREVAVVGIAALAVPGFDDLVTPALRDPAPQIRTAAIRAVATVDKPEIRRLIAELRNDPDAEVRETARKSLLRTVG